MARKTKSDCSAFDYYGGKSNWAPAIAARLPRDGVQSYVEVFGGSAAVLLANDPRFPIETYNDLDAGVVNFFRVLREDPEELIRLITLTPYSREEFRRCLDVAPEGLEGARAFFLGQMASWAGQPPETPGNFTVVRNVPHAKRTNGYLSATRRLGAVAARFRGVQIECMDALALIAKYDDPGALFYVDPPYLPETRRGGAGAYRHEMTAAEHVALAALLYRIEGRAVVSGYDSKLYGRLYHGWRRELLAEVLPGSSTLRGQAARRQEYLWFNF